MDGIKKTALFLSGLEWKTVDLLLGRLDPDAARAVRREMMALENVSATETNRLAGEFLRAASAKRAGQARREGVTYHRPVNRLSPVRPVEVESARPFDFFRDADAASLAREISGEHPQTVAVVLAHLPAALAGDVLARLPGTLPVDVARRLAEFEPMDEQVLRDIEAGLKERFENRTQTERRRALGTAAVKQILKTTDPTTQAKILSTLQTSTLDELGRLDDATLSALFRSVDLRTALLALIGAPPDLIRRITSRLSPTEEHVMRQELKRLGKVDPAAVARARRTILEKMP